MFAKQFIKKEKSKIAIICILIMLIVTLLGCTFLANNSSYSLASLSLSEKQNREFIYLSDLDYLTTSGMSQNGWSGHNIQKDKNQEGGILSLIINGEKRPYAKGLSIHANGWATYDIESLSNEYTRFTAKLGVDASRNTNGSLFYRIYVSQDATTWETLLQTPILNGASEAINVDLNITGYKYLRIYVDANGDNSSDHGTIVSAKLVKADYVEQDLFYDKINKVEYYDNILKNQSPEDNYNNNHKTFLVRELVNKLGYWNIQNAVEVDEATTEVLDWILENNRVLEETVEVGEIGNGALFLKVMSNIYQNYKDEFKTTNGYVYEKMMIALAAAYSTDRIISPLSFGFPVASYDYVERFKIMKDYFDNNEFRKFSTNVLQGGAFEPHDWFKDYHVQLMRMVMQDGTSNIDLKWLNGFTKEKQSVSFYMIGYVSPTYGLDKYYAEENREKYDQQFYLSKYGVPYGLVNGTKISRYWMIFANGGICWNASRAGQSMYRVNGIPATGAYQVGHELYLQYYQYADGTGYWSTRYGNWSGAGSTWGGSNPYRYMFNWNNKYFADRHISGSKVATSTGYLYLAQDNLNHYDAYKESAYYNLIANSYDDNAQKVATYNKALEINPINLDSYDGLINVYKVMSANGEISSEDWYELALKVIDAYEFHPVAMFDLLKVIRPYLEGSLKLHIDNLEKETLTRATRTTTAFQAEAVRIHANNLLYKVQPDPMTFSFDGDKGGVIVKNPIYQLAWGYSLDGGNTWKKFNNDGTETEFTDAEEIALTKAELESITSENDIKFKFMGLADFDFTIDIIDGTLSNLLYGNDLENRVIGVDLTYEWRNSENEPWTSYRVASPNNTGNKTLEVRRGATGNSLPSASETFTFTEDNQANTRKYVSVSHLTVIDFSTESADSSRPFYAPNAVDGNGKTLWHTDFRENVLTTGKKPFITIMLDKPRFISALEFKQLKYRSVDPCYIKNARIYISEDRENWILAGQIENCPEDEELRVINFAESVYGQYIKIEMDTYNMFSSLALVNVFQDMTKNPRPTAGIGYSTTEPTRENVIARLVNPSTNITITNNGGSDTYVFTEEGVHEFTFEFVDESGVKGTSKAVVYWIDRTAPTATIEYSTNNPINSSVFATLKPSEDIKVTNNGYYSTNDEGEVFDKDGHIIPDYTADENGVVKDSAGKIIDPLTYEFLDNGEFTFEFVDKAGNVGSATAKVDWIDFERPEATLTYSKTTLTNEDVVVTISFNEEARVLNNDNKTTYTFTDNGEFVFEFSDLAGNKGTITAKVDWMDKIAPTAELKYERTAEKVTVTVINPSEEITFKEGIGVYEFTKNGNYEIIFYDKVGNVGKLIANITGLKDGSSEDNKPDKPNPPVEPDKPTNPSNPDDNKPSEPDNKPDDNKPNENPGNNDNNKPNTNPGNNSGGNNNPSSGTENNKPVEPINKEYQEYSTANVSVQIPTKELNGEVTLKSGPFALPSSLLNTFGELSEYYDIYLNRGLERIDFTSENPIKIRIKRNKSKRFIGVYEITENNKVKPVDYERNGDYIEIVANKLGKYVVSYKEMELPSNTIVIPGVIDKNESSMNLTYIFVGLCIVAFGISFYMFYSKKG